MTILELVDILRILLFPLHSKARNPTNEMCERREGQGGGRIRDARVSNIIVSSCGPRNGSCVVESSSSAVRISRAWKRKHQKVSGEGEGKERGTCAPCACHCDDLSCSETSISEAVESSWAGPPRSTQSSAVAQKPLNSRPNMKLEKSTRSTDRGARRGPNAIRRAE